MQYKKIRYDKKKDMTKKKLEGNLRSPKKLIKINCICVFLNETIDSLTITAK